ncbi:hypothetical protein [Zobellia uliginosa]|uniref:hypothetical protein n=1 Tax=Zobellia uliginosa TaxID=143224 RepID=UPI001C078ABC|nr:hypothetical protein [Zobellia uliginosa]MBU2945800.1 hypothetical protein [Zobellia uliginosa]
MVTLILQNENVIPSTIPILFDKTEPKEVANAHTLYGSLLDFCLKIGVYPYRVPTVFQNEYLSKLNWENSLAFKLKSTLHPNNILAPNRCSK